MQDWHSTCLGDFGFGLREPFPESYTMKHYLSSMLGVDLRGCVHVTAVTEPQDVEAESAWITDVARGMGLIRAIVGTVDIRQRPREIEMTLDRECSYRIYRGIRLLGGLDYDGAVAEALLRALASRHLVYDAVARSDGGIAAAARGLRRHDALRVVLEHTGWPVAAGKDAFQAWRREVE